MNSPQTTPFLTFRLFLPGLVFYVVCTTPSIRRKKQSGLLAFFPVLPSSTVLYDFRFRSRLRIWTVHDIASPSMFFSYMHAQRSSSDKSAVLYLDQTCISSDSRSYPTPTVPPGVYLRDTGHLPLLKLQMYGDAYQFSGHVHSI